MKERVALINRIRGLLSEYGIVIAKSASNLRRELPGILEDALRTAWRRRAPKRLLT